MRRSNLFSRTARKSEELAPSNLQQRRTPSNSGPNNGHTTLRLADVLHPRGIMQHSGLPVADKYNVMTDFKDPSKVSIRDQDGQPLAYFVGCLRWTACGLPQPSTCWTRGRPFSAGRLRLLAQRLLDQLALKSRVFKGPSLPRLPSVCCRKSLRLPQCLSLVRLLPNQRKPLSSLQYIR